MLQMMLGPSKKASSSTATTNRLSQNNSFISSFTVMLPKKTNVVTPPESPSPDVCVRCVQCSEEFLTQWKQTVRCEKCHQELVNAMNQWNTYLTSQGYHPLKIVRTSQSNMKIRMKKCHADWEWKYLWILSRLSSLIDKSKGKTTTLLSCPGIQAMKNGLRELRMNLLDGKFESEMSIERYTVQVWKKYLKSDKVAFDMNSKEGYKCAFGLNAYFNSMRGHSMRDFRVYRNNKDERGKRWYNASCRSKIYNVEVELLENKDIDTKEEEEEEEEEIQETIKSSKYALSKEKKSMMLSRVSEYIEPYGDFAYTQLRIGVRDDTIEMYQNDTMVGMESRARDCRGDVITRAHMYCGGESIRRMWHETPTIVFPNIIEHPEKYRDVNTVISEFMTISSSEPEHAGIMILFSCWEPASYDTAIFHINLRFEQLEKKMAIISTTTLRGEFQVALVARESLYHSDVDMKKLLKCFVPEEEEEQDSKNFSKPHHLPIPRSAIWIGLVWRKSTVTPPATPGVVAMEVVEDEKEHFLLDNAGDAMDI